MVESTFILKLLYSRQLEESYSEDEFLRAFPKWVEDGADLRASRDQKNTLYQAIAIGWENLALAIASHPKYQAEGNYQQDREILFILVKEAKYPLLRRLLTDGFIFKGNEKKIVSKLWDEFLYDKNKTELLGIINEFSHMVSQSIQREYPKPKVVTQRNSEKYLHRVLNLSKHRMNSYEYVMKRNFMKISSFMLHPVKVVHSLQKFEEVLAQSWQAKFPEQSVQEALGAGFIFDEYAGSQWPIPTKEFAGFKKNGFLQTVTKDYLQKKHGIGHQFFKFFYLVPENNFQEIIEQGAIFTESSLNPIFLTHGKAIHNIGRILLLDAWDDLGLRLRYKSQFKNYTVTPEKLIKALFDKNLAEDNGLIPWVRLFDSKASHFTMSDPWQFHSYLMHDCKNTLPHLSLLLTHSFCKAVLRIKEFLEESTKIAWDIDEVWKQYITARIPSELSLSFDAEMKWMKSTGRLDQIVPPTDDFPVLQHRLDS